MNGWKQSFVVMALAAASAFAQPAPPVPPVAPVAPLAPLAPFPPFPDFDVHIAKAQADWARAAADWAKLGVEEGLKFGIESSIAGLINQSGMAFQKARTTGGRSDAAYDNGRRALDDHKYEEAVRRFDEVIDSKSPRADGALYWKAYALNRLGRRDDALAALTVLRRDYPNSRWLNDAQALEGEAKQGTGQAVSPAQETNEDLKLMAINSLMNADPERAMPLIEGLLKGNSTPKVKDQAMFVLTQNRSPRAEQILTDYAKGAGNPDLQMRAIRYIGMSGANEARQQMVSIYTASGDARVKRQIIQSLMMSNSRDALFNLAKNEKDPVLRAEAITQLGAMRAIDQLGQLYASETSEDNKVQIVHGLFIAGATDKLLDLMKTEKEGRVRDEAIRNLAMSHSTSPETLAGLYTSETGQRAKRELVNGMFTRGDAKPLIDLARRENDPAMKRYIVERLSTMHSKEATDYMMELLK
jgi:tetratricopeptide (TPR) repeat protein